MAENESPIAEPSAIAGADASQLAAMVGRVSDEQLAEAMASPGGGRWCWTRSSSEWPMTSNGPDCGGRRGRPLGEGGGNMAVAHRIQRGRQAQIEQLAGLARTWLEARDGRTPKAEIDRTARLLGYAIAGLAESGARLLLSEPDTWTPETLGHELGRLAAAAQGAV
jgi:hypothetical protein